MGIKALINLLTYDVELGTQFLKEATEKNDESAIQYWIGWKSAKEQDLERIKRLTEEA